MNEPPGCLTAIARLILALLRLVLVIVAVPAILIAKLICFVFGLRRADAKIMAGYAKFAVGSHSHKE